jgi:hypothetical protein
MTTNIKTLAVALSAVAAAGTTLATPTLKITDLSTLASVTITDQLPGDANGAVGAVTWVGSLGTWTINVDTGTTKPALGSAVNPRMDLAFLGVSGGAGSLRIQFSETGFGPAMGGGLSQIGGTTEGTVSFANYYDGANTLLAETTLINGGGPLGPGAFSDNIGHGPISPPTPYSLTLDLSIVHTAAGATSGDDFLCVPDGGLTVSLLGFAMVSVGYLRRRLAA